MSEIDTGGPAFPFQGISSTGEPYQPDSGMTLRDYFAGQVLARIARDDTRSDEMIGMSAWCYAIADAMLKARKRIND